MAKIFVISVRVDFDCSLVGESKQRSTICVRNSECDLMKSSMPGMMEI
jgi:hypothetical protein